jgi:hypothetical protein
MAGCSRPGQVRRHNDESGAAHRWRHATLVVGGFTLLLGLTGLVSANIAQASQPAKALGRTWTIETTPNATGAAVNELSAVSCASPRACTAVGSYAKTLSTPSVPLAERWNGKIWRRQAPAVPAGTASTFLYGVSCTSATACTAVGNAFHKATKVNLIVVEAWNGKSWRIKPAPTPSSKGSSFFAVSCTSGSACTAVGFYSNAAGNAQAFAERWNGKTWRIQAVPRPSKLTWFFGVSCSSPRACTAVGYQNKGSGDALPFAEAWNGAKWRVLKVPLPRGVPGGAFNAVSCTSPSACTATGTAFGSSPTLAERWNGKSWRIQPTPNPPGYQTSAGEVALDGVSCTSATACTASGEYSPGGTAAYFAEAWNGKSWSLQTTPVPAGFKSGALLGVSCVPARCTAVGAYTAQGPQVTLAMAR